MRMITEKRKRLLLHQVQSKTTFTIMGIMFLGIAIILSIIGFLVFNNHSKLSDITSNSSLTIQKIDNIAAIQDNVIEDLLTYSHTVRDPKQKLTIEEIAMDHYNNITTLKRNITDTQNDIKTINNIISTNIVMVIIIMAVIVIQGLALTFIGLRMGNRIAGPLMIISRFLKDYIDGKNPELRPLRKDDELQEFYELFAEAVGVVRKREKDLQENK